MEEKIPAKNDKPSPTKAELSAAFSRAKDMEETGRKEAERLREQLLDAGVTIGYEDDSILVSGRAELDGFCVVHAIESRKLEQLLREEGLLKEAMEPKKLSLSRVRALAKINERVARCVGSLETESPVFKRKTKLSK